MTISRSWDQYLTWLASHMSDYHATISTHTSRGYVKAFPGDEEEIEIETMAGKLPSQIQIHITIVFMPDF